MFRLAEQVQHVSVMKDYWDTLTDPAHLLTELTVEAFTGFIGFVFGRKWLVRHDRDKHGAEPTYGKGP